MESRIFTRIFHQTPLSCYILHMQYAILSFFRNLETPFLNTLANILSMLGEEGVMIFIMLIVYYVWDKRTGYCVFTSLLGAQVMTNGIKAIVRQLRASCPEAKITLLKIFPRGANGQDPKRKLNDAINARLPELADEEHVFLRDVGPYYLMPDGDTLNKALLPDLLHPTKEGHRLWAAAIARDFLNDYE